MSPAAVSHGSLSVTIKEEQTVSQPAPFSKLGQTVVVNNSTIKVDQGSNRMFLFKPGVELEQIVRAVNDVGAAPGDLVAILEALQGGRRAAGRADRDLNDHAACPLSCRCRPGVGAADTSAANTYTDLNGLGGAEEGSQLAAGDQRGGAAGRGAVSADDAEEHARRRAASGEPDSNEMGMYQDMFDKQVALTISQHQDFGIGALVETAVVGRHTRHAGRSQPRSPPAPAVAQTPAAAAEPPRRPRRSPGGDSSNRRCCRPSAAPPPPWASIRWGCWHRPRSRPAGASACRAPPTAAPASIMFGIKAGE